MTSGIRRRQNSGSKVSKPPQIVKTKEKSVEQSDVQSSSSDSSTCGNILKVLLFVIVAPPMMNYAGLRQEREHLSRNITMFDVGFGQKLFMSCLGEGRPTVILDSPTGATSDVWLSGQLQLASVTRVSRRMSAVSVKCHTNDCFRFVFMTELGWAGVIPPQG